MTFIPKAFCACGYEMVIETTGVMLEANAIIGSYYKVASDLYRCPSCGNGAYLGMQGITAEHFQPGYADRKADVQVHFAETLRVRA